MRKPLEIFEQNRTRLRNLAYRLLGSTTDTDDMLQELYVRWHRSDTAELRSPEAWLTTVLTRLCIDRMRSRQRELDSYPGSWLPEPLYIAEPLSPSSELDLADDLSLALLIVLERLTPEERAAFLLHDVFDHDYHEVGTILGKTEIACRQLLHRARKRLRVERPRFQVSQETRRRLLIRFIESTQTMDREALMRVLAEDATLTTDSGGKVRAALNVICGHDRIARLLIGLAKKRIETTAERLMLVNGELGVVTYLADRPVSVICVETDETKITKLYRVVNPEKLRTIHLPNSLGPASVGSELRR